MRIADERGSRRRRGSAVRARRRERQLTRMPAASVLRTPTARVLDEGDEARGHRLLATDPVARVRPRRPGRGRRARRRRRSARRSGGSATGGGLEAVCLAGANLIPFAVPAPSGPPPRLRRARPAGPAGAARRSSARRRRSPPLWDLLAPALGPGPRPPPAPAADGHRRAAGGRRRPAGPPRSGPTSSRRCCPPAVAMFTEEVGVTPLRVDGGAATAPGSPNCVRAGQSLAWIEDGEVLFKAEIGAVTRAACQVQGVWVAPALPRPRASARPGRPPSSSTPARRSPRWSASTSTTSTPPPAPPTAGSASARSGSTPASSSEPATERLARSDTSVRRADTTGPGSRHCAADHRSRPGRLLRQRRGRRARRRRSLPRGLGGRRQHRGRRASDRRPRAGHGAAPSRPPPTSPDADADRRLGEATVEDGIGDRRLDRRRGTSPPPPSGPTTRRCTCARAATSWQVVAEPALVHPELGEGQHLLLARSLPERAPITDAAGAPLFTPDRGGQRRRRPGPGHRPAGAGRRALGRHRHRGRGHRRRRRGRPRRPVRPRDHPAPSGLRGDPRPRCSTCRARSSRPRRGCSRPAPASPSRCSAASGRPPPRSSRRPRRTASPRYAAGDQLGLSGLQRAFQEQLTGTAGFTVPVVSTDEDTGDEGREIDVRRAGAGQPAADAARPGGAERRRRRRRRPAAADAPRRRPAGHRRDPRRLLQRGRRRRQRPGRAVPAGLEHEDDHRHRAAVGRRPHPGHRRCPAPGRRPSRAASSRTRTSSTWAP